MPREGGGPSVPDGKGSNGRIGDVRGGGASKELRPRQTRWKTGIGVAALAAVALIGIAFRSNLRGALVRLGMAGDAAGIGSVAVLPFSNVSGDAQQEYFVME